VSINITCHQCHKIFKVRPSYQFTKKFCSIECKGKWQTLHIRGGNHPNYVERIERLCKNCKKPMYITPYYLKIKFYCSRKCKSVFQSQFMSGENNPGWKGGVGEPWKRWGAKFTRHYKKQIKERDNYTCQRCKILEKESRIKFVIHHKDFNPKNGSHSNLILLCNSCHMIIHNNLKKPTTIT